MCIFFLPFAKQICSTKPPVINHHTIKTRCCAIILAQRHDDKAANDRLFDEAASETPQTLSLNIKPWFPRRSLRITAPVVKITRTEVAGKRLEKKKKKKTAPFAFFPPNEFIRVTPLDLILKAKLPAVL